MRKWSWCNFQLHNIEAKYYAVSVLLMFSVEMLQKKAKTTDFNVFLLEYMLKK